MTEPTTPVRPDANAVRRIAELARLRITHAETARFAGQFASILGHMETLLAVDTTGVAPLDHPLPLTDVLRDDEPAAGLSRYDALCRAPDATSDSFRVPRVMTDREG
jgi:aspartyl-tRNA(Asn)/glutamyl-tRNA(Gln) amidotransferase subunit C